MTHTSHSGPDVFDLLIEQRDQELARDGVVSPSTARQLEAYERGEPIPRISLNSPAIQAATARVLQSFRRYRELQANPHAVVHEDEDDGWGGWDEEDI